MKDIQKGLGEAGLSAKESLVYESLLKNGPISGGELSKLLNIDRTHTYNLLRNLINKGLASQRTKNRKNFFITTSPKNLLNEVLKREQIISSIIPKLEIMQKEGSPLPKINVLEGKAGLRTIFQLFFESKVKEFYTFGASAGSYKFLEYEMPHFAKKAIRNKIKGKIIGGKEFKGHHFTKLSNIQTRYIDDSTNTTTTIIGDNVILMIFEEKLTIILIESKSVSNSYKKYFDILWEVAKK